MGQPPGTPPSGPGAPRGDLTWPCRSKPRFQAPPRAPVQASRAERSEAGPLPQTTRPRGAAMADRGACPLRHKRRDSLACLPWPARAMHSALTPTPGSRHRFANFPDQKMQLTPSAINPFTPAPSSTRVSSKSLTTFQKISYYVQSAFKVRFGINRYTKTQKSWHLKCSI